MKRPSTTATKPFENRPALREWVAHGYRCALVQAPLYGAINGYVKAALSSEQVAQVKVHGGITYEGSEWVGFDTGSLVWIVLGQALWDEEKVAAETERLAAECKRVSEL